MERPESPVMDLVQSLDTETEYIPVKGFQFHMPEHGPPYPAAVVDLTYPAEYPAGTLLDGYGVAFTHYFDPHKVSVRPVRAELVFLQYSGRETVVF